ncbi:hypothetical protein [Streptomyces deccanensis]|uniref:hypothetical protein n=1 Tax=Streptomyces deccanensis TaxID=424188 RepID=UPI001EFB709D|nr:hypothetical protein [Streptomyces deccanensis]ULR47838.1 hypothetical protein L3078_00230 [Streptomyces deccanensis]
MTSRGATIRQATTPTESPLLSPTSGNTSITSEKTTASYLGVIDGVLDTALRLDWSTEDSASLLAYALSVCEHVDIARFPDTVKKAMAAASNLSRGNEALRIHTEQEILRRAADLDGYDLRDALNGDWLPQTATTPAMAQLRLRQVRDPRVNDRLTDLGSLG